MENKNRICRFCGITRKENNNDFMASGKICYNCYIEKIENKKRGVSRFDKK